MHSTPSENLAILQSCAHKSLAPTPQFLRSSGGAILLRKVRHTFYPDSNISQQNMRRMTSHHTVVGVQYHMYIYQLRARTHANHAPSRLPSTAALCAPGNHGAKSRGISINRPPRSPSPKECCSCLVDFSAFSLWPIHISGFPKFPSIPNSTGLHSAVHTSGPGRSGASSQWPDGPHNRKVVQNLIKFSVGTWKQFLRQV